MSITQNDFKKIWASTSSVPEYTFSDSDYQDGWEFVGELPPTRAMWDTLQRRNDQKMKYLQDNGSMCFDSVADMVSTDLEAGQTVITKGYYSVNDGGLALYTIRAKDVADVDDGGSIIFLDNGNVAELIEDNVNVCQFGTHGDGVNDDSDAVQNLIDLTEKSGEGYVYFPTFKNNYRFTKSIKFMLGDIRIFGDKGIAYTHPFTDGTNRLMRKGNLIGATSAPCILDLGNYQTKTSGDTSPYPSNPSRNLAQSWTVDHLTLRGEGSAEVDGIALTDVQNGPHRIHSFDTISGYNLKNGIHIIPPATGVTIQVANLSVKNCSFNFSKKAVYSEGGVYDAVFDNCNFEANAEGAIHGAFNGTTVITNNMLENTPNPISIEAGSDSSLIAHGNYFEYHPTSDYLYKVKGVNYYNFHSIDVNDDYDSPNIATMPTYRLVLGGTGRWKIQTTYKTLFKDINNVFIICQGSNAFANGGIDIDHLQSTIVAYVEDGFDRQDSSNDWIYDYPHDPNTYYEADTPLGKMNVVDLADGIRINPGEYIQNKLICNIFMIRAKPTESLLSFPASLLQARTTGGQYMVNPGNIVDYIQHDISQGKWCMVAIVWKPTNLVNAYELYVAESLRGIYEVAGVCTKVYGSYAGDGTDAIVRIKPVTLRRPSA